MSSDGKNQFEIHVDSDMFESLFFLPNLPEEEIYMKRSNQSEKERKDHKNSVLNIVDEKSVGASLIDLYRDIKDPTYGFIVGDWKFLSPNEIKKYEKGYNSKGWIDIALNYLGVGWIGVIGYMKDSDTFFIRIDGGSNGYDRAFNCDKYTSESFDPTKFQVKDEQLNGKVVGTADVIRFTYSGLMKNLYPEWIL